jgi:hypothetical protein
MFFSTPKTFDTEKLVHTDCTQKFLQTDFFARRNFTRSSFFTAETFSHRSLYALKKYAQLFLQTDGFYRQKIIRTEVLRTEGFTHNIFNIQTLLHTDVFSQTQIAHRNLCTQHAFKHSQLLHREALLPLLDHLPFVFPLSNFLIGEWINAYSILWGVCHIHRYLFWCELLGIPLVLTQFAISFSVDPSLSTILLYELCIVDDLFNYR